MKYASKKIKDITTGINMFSLGEGDEFYTTIEYIDGTNETWFNETEAGAIRFHKKIEAAEIERRKQNEQL